jgi:nucleotidyltransferase substrate binding protein (TIGR01987 family)
MEPSDVRWLQRFSNFEKAFAQLARFIAKGQLNEFEEQGLIKSFEYTYELAWNTIKDYYEYQGETGIQGSRDCFQLAFKRGLLDNGQVWMDMLRDRNRTAHTYNQNTATIIVHNIRVIYFNAFVALKTELEKYQHRA